MIIDCHGHYTTAPAAHEGWRKQQIDARGNPGSEGPVIRDDEIRESLEGAQLRLQRERGTDLTIFSPRAGGMGHHIGNEATSQQWSRHLQRSHSARLQRSIPKNFVGVCQLPQ